MANITRANGMSGGMNKIRHKYLLVNADTGMWIGNYDSRDEAEAAATKAVAAGDMPGAFVCEILCEVARSAAKRDWTGVQEG